MRPVEGYIPPNINSDSIIGQFKWRNLIEAAIVFAVTVIIAYNLKFIPIIPRIIGFILIAGPLTLLAAIGVNDEPISSFIMSFFIFRSTRCTVKLRMPMPHIMTEQERKAAKIEEKAKEKEAKKEKLEKNKEKAKGMFGNLFKKKGDGQR